MPDLTGNIPSSMYYGSIMSEFLRIARCTLLLSDFVPRARTLFLRMADQGGTKNRVLQQIKKAMLRHPGPFKKFQTDCNTIISLITTNWYTLIKTSIGFFFFISFWRFVTFCNPIHLPYKLKKKRWYSFWQQSIAYSVFFL